MPAAGDAGAAASEDNGGVDRAGDWRAGRAEALRRLATAPHAPAVTGTLLAVAAVGQAIALPRER